MVPNDFFSLAQRLNIFFSALDQVRRCVVAKLKELDGSVVKKLLADNVGSLLVVLPDNFDDGMDEELKEKLRDIEVAVFGNVTYLSIGSCLSISCSF